MRVKSMIIAGITSVIMAGGALADGHEGPFAKEIKARKAVFQVYGYNMGLLGGMAKGKMEYDAQTAVDAAWNLNAASMMKNGTMWPQGSDNGSVEGTRALPEIWSTYPAMAKRVKVVTTISVPRKSNKK